jgi:hypothetical protein
MTRAVYLPAICLALLSFNALAQLTNYGTETQNNTSANGSAYQYYGTSPTNAIPRNVSTVDMRPLLYTNATTKVYAHIMGWFCMTGTGNYCSSHIKSGYSSDDSTVAQKQLQNMRDRQMSGAILDWYGDRSGSVNSAAALNLKQAAAGISGFEFAPMLDQGSVDSCMQLWSNCACLPSAPTNCTPTTQVIHDLNYAYHTFHENIASSIRINGRPVHTLYFRPSGSQMNAVDWSFVRTHLDGNPLLIFEEWIGGTQPSVTDGGFAWLCTHTSNPNSGCTSDPSSLQYLNDFYWNARNNSNLAGKQMLGSGFQGFNDKLAGWSDPNNPRLVNSNCGETWIDSLGRAGAAGYSQSSQLARLQIVTWNDYDEGSVIEPGISNCIGNIPLTMSGTTLSWRVDFTDSTDHERTIQEYQIFSSTDGDALTRIGTVLYGTGVHSFDVGPSGPTSRTQFYVKALGKSNIQNFMSAPVCYNSSGCVKITVNQPGDYVNLGSSMLVNATATGSTSETITSMQVYVGGTLKNTTNGNSLNVTIPMTTGEYLVGIKAWTSTGNYNYQLFRNVYIK